LFSDACAARELRVRHEWLGSRPLLLFAGTFGRVNGMEYLVRLAAEVQRVDPGIRLVAVGGGAEFERTQALARELRVLDTNLFLLGKVPKSEAAVWTVAADMTLALFTGPEIVWRDAVQNKFFDSLAAGKPVVNNFRGWQSEVAVAAGAGLIVSATDIEAAARDVSRALRNPDWMARAGQAARELGVRRFNRDALAAQLAGVLAEAHAQPR
jgi:glycosyltransferase involved in cell wall biosynthesis